MTGSLGAWRIKEIKSYLRLYKETSTFFKTPWPDDTAIGELGGFVLISQLYGMIDLNCNQSSVLLSCFVVLQVWSTDTRGSRWYRPIIRSLPALQRYWQALVLLSSWNTMVHFLLSFSLLQESNVACSNSAIDNSWIITLVSLNSVLKLLLIKVC